MYVYNKHSRELTLSKDLLINVNEKDEMHDKDVDND